MPDISQGFEVLLSSTNLLNRKLEEVHGMTKEYQTIASLWSSFHDLMRIQGDPAGQSATPQLPVIGLPGTGSHLVSSSTKLQDQNHS